MVSCSFQWFLHLLLVANRMALPNEAQTANEQFACCSNWHNYFLHEKFFLLLFGTISFCFWAFTTMIFTLLLWSCCRWESSHQFDQWCRAFWQVVDETRRDRGKESIATNRRFVKTLHDRFFNCFFFVCYTLNSNLIVITNIFSLQPFNKRSRKQSSLKALKASSELPWSMLKCKRRIHYQPKIKLIRKRLLKYHRFSNCLNFSFTIFSCKTSSNHLQEEVKPYLILQNDTTCIN